LLPPGDFVAAIAIISSASVAVVTAAVLAEAELSLDGDGEEEDESAGEEGKSGYRHYTLVLSVGSMSDT